MYRQPPRLPENPTPAQLDTYQTECITHLANVMDDDRRDVAQAFEKLQEENAALKREIAQVRQFAQFEKDAPTHRHAPHGQALLTEQKWARLLFVLDSGGW